MGHFLRHLLQQESQVPALSIAQYDQAHPENRLDRRRGRKIDEGSAGRTELAVE